MPNELREVVAAAIYGNPSVWKRLNAEFRSPYFRKADAVIAAMFKAMETPSEEMIKAGSKAVDRSPMKGGIDKDTATAWQPLPAPPAIEAAMGHGR